jgi:carbohydrate kinase (thermoresistant glucokinase family)
MTLYVVMGVSGCGKSTAAALLAAASGGDFLDADDYHPASNKAKMAASIPLVDEDRADWLDLMNDELKKRSGNGRKTFLACSALKQIYRDRLATDLPLLRFIYLKGSRAAIGSRLKHRNDHFMPATLLESQISTLEEPTDALTVSIEQPLDQVVAEILERLAGM